jgi:Hypothetical protein (DUF2513)
VEGEDTMKRDLELIRRLLLETEELYKGSPISLGPNEDDEFTNAEIQYHLRLMGESGLINYSDYTTKDGPLYMIKGLTWSGHDFLDAARNDKVWDEAKVEAEKKGSKFKDLPFEIAKALLIQVSKNMFGV